VQEKVQGQINMPKVQVKVSYFGCCGCTVPPAWRQRTLLVIYEADCSQHVDVVRQLTQLLQTQCNFEVLSEMTRQEEIRLSITDFVLDSFKQADVVLVVVSENLRSAWRAQRHDNSSTPSDNRLPSVGELLLQRLRDEVVIRPRRMKLVAARFDYTPEMTNIDTDLALVPEVYELTSNIYRLLLSLQGVNKRTQLLNFVCCLRLAPDDTMVDISTLKETVAVARQHYHQQQVPVTRDATELASAGLVAGHGISVSSEQATLLDTPRLCEVHCSLDSVFIDQYISQFNQDYDNESS